MPVRIQYCYLCSEKIVVLLIRDNLNMPRSIKNDIQKIRKFTVPNYPYLRMWQSFRHGSSTNEPKMESIWIRGIYIPIYNRWWNKFEERENDKSGESGPVPTQTWSQFHPADRTSSWFFQESHRSSTNKSVGTQWETNLGWIILCNTAYSLLDRGFKI